MNRRVGRKRYEAVNHPAHYGGAANPHEVIKVLEAWWPAGVPFTLGNVIKYLARAGKRPDKAALEDLKKARWYLDREIANQERRK